MTLTPEYQEYILNAPDICRNCFHIVREERHEHERRRSDVTVRESKWSRRHDTTDVEYAPAETASNAKGIFCTCGVEGSYVRIWDDTDITRHQFREFIKRVLRSLEHKGVSVDRKAALSYALDAYDDRSGKYRRYREHGHIDDALSTGVQYGIARAEVTSRTQNQPDRTE